MDPEDQTSDSTLTDTGAKSTSSSASSAQSVDWERRFKGLQAAFDKLQKKYDALEAANQQVSGELEEVRQGARGHETEKKSLSDRLTQIEAEKTTLQSQIETHQKDVERTRLILGEFQDLANFEAKSLLPQAANIDELRQKLTDYREAVKGMVSSGVQNRLSGQAPASSGSAQTGGSRNADQVYAELVGLAGSRDPKERARYQEVLKEWDEISKK